ncbi:MAG TPA: shikimate kinase II [Planctomycetes bacterium]|nr:shikimate kinase II [Planctomycetota bacterium]
MNVYLTGLRGSGKSTVGRVLAERIGWEFSDQDELVVQRAECSVADIFARGGELEFRRLESEILRELAGRSGVVVAAGGGVVLSEENRSLMRNSGLVIHLDGPADVFVRRIVADPMSGEARPALTGETDDLKEMQLVAGRRAPLYEAARHAWVSAVDAPEKVAERIQTIMRERGVIS